MRKLILVLALVALPGAGANAQRVADRQIALRVEHRHPARESATPQQRFSRHKTPLKPYVLSGMAIGAAVGLMYREATIPDDGDWLPMISIPIYAGGGALLGGVVGAVVGQAVRIRRGEIPEK